MCSKYFLKQNLNNYIMVEVLLEDLIGLLPVEEAPMVIVQLSDETYAAIAGFKLDQDGALVGLKLVIIDGEILLGGTDEIVTAWYYVMAESAATPSSEPSASSEATVMPEPTPSTVATQAPTVEATPVIEQTPTPAPTETPAA